jgi:hypothetical protein
MKPLHLVVDILELSIPVSMLTAFFCLLIGLQTVTEAVQKLSDLSMTYFITLPV